MNNNDLNRRFHFLFKEIQERGHHLPDESFGYEEVVRVDCYKFKSLKLEIQQDKREIITGKDFIIKKELLTESLMFSGSVEELEKSIKDK